jgi:hypothetical protein
MEKWVHAHFKRVASLVVEPFQLAPSIQFYDWSFISRGRS